MMSATTIGTTAVNQLKKYVHVGETAHDVDRIQR